jgi:hypothetical protein
MISNDANFNATLIVDRNAVVSDQQVPEIPHELNEHAHPARNGRLPLGGHLKRRPERKLNHASRLASRSSRPERSIQMVSAELRGREIRPASR